MTSWSAGDSFGMGKPSRYITTHDASGKSILVAGADLAFRSFAGGAVSRAFALESVPASISNNQDLQSYRSEDGAQSLTSYTLAGQQTTVPGGVNMTYFDLGPGAMTTMHRTVSVDFMVVLEGELEMELDGGEKVSLRPGDSVVQRATMHKWRNMSSEKPVRVFSVLCASEQIEVDGKKIQEEWLQD